MAIQLVKLRHMPADELEEIHALMTEHDIEVYETGAGNWGISMPALWLRHDWQYEHAKALLDSYAEERFQRVHGEYQAMKAAGKARTFLDIARENPIRYFAYVVMIGALIYISLIPFISLI